MNRFLSLSFVIKWRTVMKIFFGKFSFFVRKMYEIILRNSPSSSFSRLCRIISCLAMIFLRKIRGKGRSLAKELVVNLFLDRLSEGDWNRRAASPLLTLIEFRVERARIIRATLPCTCINYYLVTWYLLLNRLPDTWHAFKQLTFETSEHALQGELFSLARMG